jgi:transposase
MDVPKDSLTVAYVAQDHGAEGMYLGGIGTHQCDLDQRLCKKPSQATHLSFVYEADPGGYWLYRYLTQKGYDYWVVAPSLIPKKAGDCVNTDRRTAVQLARWARSGDLTAVSGPTVEDEAMRDLTRARAEAISALQDTKVRLNAFLLRQDIPDVGRAKWGPAGHSFLCLLVTLEDLPTSDAISRAIEAKTSSHFTPAKLASGFASGGRS